MNSKKIKVKLISKINTQYWLKQFPKRVPIWGNCEFIFDINEKEYDWVVVYDDLPKLENERFSKRVEKLTCKPSNTLLITTEPPNIKSYGRSFVEQFGYILTSHNDWALKHPDKIFSQPALIWFYGYGYDGEVKDFDYLSNAKCHKTKTMSTVCSSKQQKHTLHDKRYTFTWELKKLIPELDIFGHGVKTINDKSEALEEYKYHIAIENYLGEHHWTEKLSDSFLGLCLPFYHGAPNAKEYFPGDSFIEIDIFDVKKSADIIKKAIKNNEYEKRIDSIKEAKRLVLEKYNIFATISTIVENNNNKESKNQKVNGILKSRRVLMKSSAKNFFLHGYEKLELARQLKKHNQIKRDAN